MSDFKTTLLYDARTGQLDGFLHVLDQRIRFKSNGTESIDDYLSHEEQNLVRTWSPAPVSTQDENGNRARDLKTAKAWKKFAEEFDRGLPFEEAVELACLNATFGTAENDAASILIRAIDNQNSRVRAILKSWGIWRPTSAFRKSAGKDD